MVATDAIDTVIASEDVARAASSEAALARLEDLAARRYRGWGERALLGAITLGALGTFYAASRAITWERGNAIDRAIVRAVGRRRGPVSNTMARIITAFGGVPAICSAFLGATFALRKRPWLVGQVAAGALGAVTAELCIKRLFRRERPKLLEHLETVTSTSFPSGHAMASASVYLTLAFVGARTTSFRNARGPLIGGASALAMLVAGSRVYLGVHWPTDVLGGLMLGTAWACTAEAVIDLSQAGKLEELAWRRRRRARTAAEKLRVSPKGQLR